MAYGAISAACTRHRASSGALSVYLNLPGTGYAGMADSVPTSITSDIDLRVKVAMTDWTPAATSDLLTKSNTSGNNCGYVFTLNTDGTLSLGLSSTGISIVATTTSSAATGVADGAIKWVRVTMTTADMVVKFYTSDDGSSWSQLGTDRSTILSSIYDNTAGVKIGARDAGSTNVATGKFYRAQIYSGVAGTLVFDANCVGLTVGAATFAEQSSNAATVTVTANAALV